jgi:hypothetical protein
LLQIKLGERRKVLHLSRATATTKERAEESERFFVLLLTQENSQNGRIFQFGVAANFRETEVGTISLFVLLLLLLFVVHTSTKEKRARNQAK